MGVSRLRFAWYRHPGPLRSQIKVSKACLAPKAPRKARSARLLESADLRFSFGYETKLFDKDRKAKVSKALGLATDLTNTSVRSASSVLLEARLTLSSRMTVPMGTFNITRSHLAPPI